jgi:hypothetical protein
MKWNMVIFMASPPRSALARIDPRRASASRFVCAETITGRLSVQQVPRTVVAPQRIIRHARGRLPARTSEIAANLNN